MFLFKVFLRVKIWYHLTSHWFGSMYNWRGKRNVAQSKSKILVKTINSDVVFIAISVYLGIPTLHELWMEFGREKNLKYVPVHRITSNYGIMSASALPFFYALSSCDTNSSRFGKSKKTFYEEWWLYLEITTVFAKLISVQQKINYASI